MTLVLSPTHNIPILLSKKTSGIVWLLSLPGQRFLKKKLFQHNILIINELKFLFYFFEKILWNFRNLSVCILSFRSKAKSIKSNY